MKSRGSIGNIYTDTLKLIIEHEAAGGISDTLPPIWKDRVCGTAQGSVKSALEETEPRMFLTTSEGPRNNELPCGECVRVVQGG